MSNPPFIHRAQTTEFMYKMNYLNSIWGRQTKVVPHPDPRCSPGDCQVLQQQHCHLWKAMSFLDTKAPTGNLKPLSPENDGRTPHLL